MQKNWDIYHEKNQCIETDTEVTVDEVNTKTLTCVITMLKDVK